MTRLPRLRPDELTDEWWNDHLGTGHFIWVVAKDFRICWCPRVRSYRHLYINLRGWWACPGCGIDWDFYDRN